MKRILIPVSEYLFGATGMISIVLPKLHTRSNSDKMNSCILFSLNSSLNRAFTVIHTLTDFTVWSQISFITMDLPDGHCAVWPTLITITGPNPDPDSLTCTPSCNLERPLSPPTCPMIWTLAWSQLPSLGLPCLPHLATEGLGPGCALPAHLPPSAPLL